MFSLFATLPLPNTYLDHLITPVYSPYHEALARLVTILSESLTRLGYQARETQAKRVACIPKILSGHFDGHANVTKADRGEVLLGRDDEFGVPKPQNYSWSEVNLPSRIA